MSEAAPAPKGFSTSNAAQVGEAPVAPLVSPAFRSYALVVLLLVYTVNFLDRQIVSILAEPIKNELSISDTQLGLLTGLAFGIIYCGFGLPLARLADRFNRVWIISGSLAVWSACTVLCGRATSFGTLVAARMGVGLGEAGCTPTSHALIADYVPKEKRASALAFFSMGTPLGGLLGLAMGGLIADAYGWRTAFLLAGLPGLILAAVCFFTLKEPRNAMAAAARQAHASSQMGFTATCKYLAAKRTFWLLAFGAAIKAFIGYGHSPFTASFFLRNHGPEIAQLAGQFGLKPIGFMGLALGLIAGIFGTASSWLGGVIADKYGARDLRAYGSVPAIASLLVIPCYYVAYTAESAVLALSFLIPIALLGSLWYGPVYASAQSLVPANMRATSASIVLFIINMVGLGGGALVVGALSDWFNYGWGLGKADGIRWALFVSACFGLVSAVLFWVARARIRDEMVS
ncbi:MFS transporter [Phenylobacterium sp.]|uniref:spinster family MFS transporter n=1 Tax=Phenylobacterium sp. TaxID=1871053 RepID=UPI0025F254CF|nr:MFS transporter [Phenylobacterium sp.]MBX3482598.1 MFS transporter [Phenylobacterium sp.]MCW5760470.1 MFS transporter [Phenylobacterium sp.]